MKKKYLIGYIVLLSIPCMQARNAQKKPGKTEWLLAITSNHTLAFGKDNLIKSGIDTDEIRSWNELVSGVGAYIRKNDTSKSLYGYYLVLRSASNKLVATIRRLHDVYANEGLQLRGMREIAQDNLSKFNYAVASITTQLSQPSTKKKMRNVREVLERLSLTLELTIQKVFKDIDRLKVLELKKANRKKRTAI